MTAVEGSGYGIEINGLNNVLANLHTALGSTSLSQELEVGSAVDDTSLVSNRQKLGAAIDHINAAIFAGGSIPNDELLPALSNDTKKEVMEEDPVEEVVGEIEPGAPLAEDTLVLETPFARATRLRNERQERNMLRGVKKPSTIEPEGLEPKVTAICEHVLYGNALPSSLKRGDVIKALKQVSNQNGFKDREVAARFRGLNLALLGANNPAADDFITVSSNNAERSEIIGKRRSKPTTVMSPPDGTL